MNNEKVYIEGRVVGSFAGTLGSKGKKIHLINGDIVDVDDSFIIESIEPQKVKVPQFVADWIEVCKKKGDLSLGGAIQLACPEIYEWIRNWDNQETFARAWLDGYEVEEEKRYTVKIKGEIEENLLVYGLGINRYFFARDYDSSKRNEHTRKQLEEAGFGWVFDCEGIEVEEVTE